MAGEPESGGVQSAEVALNLLRALAEGGGALSLSRLAAAVNMPTAKAHRYVVSLIRAGFVEQAERNGHYSLGVQALRVGLVALGRIDVMEAATACIADLRDETNQTTMLAIWGDHGPLVVRWVESMHSVTVNVRIGSTMSLLRSATGRVFGAWAPWARVEPLVLAELGDRRSRDKSAIEKTKAIFAEVHGRGVATVVGDLLPGIQAIGAPVFNASGQLEAAITVLGPLGSFDIDPQGSVTNALRRAAQALSSRIGFEEQSV